MGGIPSGSSNILSKHDARAGQRTRLSPSISYQRDYQAHLDAIALGSDGPRVTNRGDRVIIGASTTEEGLVTVDLMAST